ncbi:hypothetical protein MNEG_16325, partial [Monoraphidium neglectum]
WSRAATTTAAWGPSCPRRSTAAATTLCTSRTAPATSSPRACPTCLSSARATSPWCRCPRRAA